MKLFRDYAANERPMEGSGEDEFAVQRAEMVERQLRRRGVHDSVCLKRSLP